MSHICKSREGTGRVRAKSSDSVATSNMMFGRKVMRTGEIWRDVDELEISMKSTFLFY